MAGKRDDEKLLGIPEFAKEGPETLIALATDGQACKVGVLQMLFHPRDVIRRDRKKTLSPVIRAGWLETAGEDPVVSAWKSIRARRKRVAWGMVLLALAALIFFGAFWIKVLPDSSFLGTLTLLGSMASMMSGIIVCFTASSPVEDFRWSWKKFGRNFSRFCILLKKSPEELVDLDKEQLQALARSALVSRAEKITNLEKKISDIFSQDPGSDTSKDAEAREEARLDLWDDYNAVRAFDLIVEKTEKEAYKAIFAAAKERRQNA